MDRNRIDPTNFRTNKRFLKELEGTLSSIGLFRKIAHGDTIWRPEVEDALSSVGYSTQKPFSGKKFYLEDVGKFENAEWRYARNPNGGFGTPLWFKEGPGYFKLLSRSSWGKEGFCIFETEDYQHKQMWPEGQAIIETMHQREAGELLEKGYSLVSTRLAEVPNEDGDRDLGHSSNERQLFLLQKK